MARLAVKAGLLVGVLLVASILVAAAQPTSQSFPSQVAPPEGKPASGFYFPEQLMLFAALEKSANGVLHGVSALDFTNANASLANYSEIVNEFYAESNGSREQLYGYIVPGNPSVFSAMATSETLYSQLIVKSKEYEALYVASTQGENDLTSNQFAQNGVVMRGLNADIKTLMDQINTTNDGIFSPAIAEGGLDMADYATAQASLSSYIARIDSQLTDLADVAFQNTTTTLVLDKNVTRYADNVHMTGTVKSAETGVPNGTVRITKNGNELIATAKTNASGGYECDFFVDRLGLGTNRFQAVFEPADQPFKASDSGFIPILVKNVTVTNELRVSSSSLLGITLTGSLKTDREPVKNASQIKFYVDGTAHGYTQTDANGAYSMRYRLTPAEYITSLFMPTNKTFSTNFTPFLNPLGEAQSNVVTQPLGTTVAAFYGSPAGLAVTALLIIAAAIGVYVRVSLRMARKPAVKKRSLDTKAYLPQVVAESTLLSPVSSVAEVTYKTYRNVGDVMSEALEFLEAHDNNGAIIATYRGALALLARAASTPIRSSLSHWEAFAIIEKRLTNIHAFRQLTHLYELASYSGREMSEKHAKMAFKDLAAIDGLLQTVGEET